MSGAACRTLFDAPRIKLGELTCPAGGPDWGKANVMGRLANIAFPRTSAVIVRSGRPPVLANANHVLVYDPHQEYSRSPVDARGWRCVFLAVDEDVLSECAAAPADGPSRRHAYVLQHLACEEAESPRPDPLRIEELLYHLLAAAVESIGPQVPHAARRARTRRVHRELVEDAKRVLTVRMSEHVSLDTLAGELYTSPYHLARLFRAHTGYTLHAYRSELRLRCALDRLPAYRGNLTGLAHELGYASLSHFSDSFCRAFGTRPSEPTQTRTILEAGARAPA